ncbi:uncharacterized protein DMENIID0001_147310 [Sergentomyia squamirostris]
MLRETLQTLTCLSVLSVTYSLHMARDSYRRDNEGHISDQVHHTVVDQIQDPHDRHSLHENNLPNIDPHLRQPLTGYLTSAEPVDVSRSNDDDLYSNTATYTHAVPPKALQDLFNTDLDMLQQHQQQQQQQQKHNKRTPSGGGTIGGGGSGGGSSGTNSGIPNLSPVPHSIANQLMLRSVRGQRQYDVPQIECPPAMDGMERFACPTPDRQGRYRCIDDHVLCDGFIDCPDGEDEDRQACMFYKTTKAHLDVLADALLRWARGR